MKIIFNDKTVEAKDGVSVYDAAAEAGVIDRSVIAAEIGGELYALTAVPADGSEVKLLTFESEGGKHVFRHTASHILAQAVKRLYPEAKLTIGPAIENGFYYDIDSDVSFTPEILSKIEDEMKKIVKENLRIERFELPREEAVALMTE